MDDIDLQWYENEIKRKVVEFVLDLNERTRGKNYDLETDWKQVKRKLGREL